MLFLFPKSRRLVPAALAIALGGVASMVLMTAPATAATVRVTNNSDAGPGSFRAAVLAANANPAITSIQFQNNLGTITLNSTIDYTGVQSLSIDGRGAVIAPSAPVDLFVADGGGDLSLKRLTFRNGVNGIVVEVPSDATGDVSVSLFEMTVEDNSHFGLLVDDLGGSSASAGVDIAFSRFARNGTAATDLDGVRVNEAGDGDIVVSIHSSEFVENGSDGVELDEGGPGDVALTVRGSAFNDNGFQDPADLDDGLDIDEDDEGRVWFRIVDSTFNGNGDDGIDMDESGEGNLYGSLVQVEVLGNGDKGVNVAENDAGDLTAVANIVLVDGNVGSGLRLREFGDGDFSARVVSSISTNNGGSDVEVREADAGTGILRLQAVTYGTIDARDVEVIEVGTP